jgi:hypothetical protein
MVGTSPAMTNVRLRPKLDVRETNVAALVLSRREP